MEGGENIAGWNALAENGSEGEENGEGVGNPAAWLRFEGENPTAGVAFCIKARVDCVRGVLGGLFCVVLTGDLGTGLAAPSFCGALLGGLPSEWAGSSSCGGMLEERVAGLRLWAASGLLGESGIMSLFLFLVTWLTVLAEISCRPTSLAERRNVNFLRFLSRDLLAFAREDAFE